MTATAAASSEPVVVVTPGEAVELLWERTLSGEYSTVAEAARDLWPTLKFRADDLSFLALYGLIEFSGANQRGTRSRRPKIAVGAPHGRDWEKRSLWHWAGLHVVADGRAPRKRKGVQSDWNSRIRASVMQPQGLAEQIVRQDTPVYVDVYRVAKARLTLRVADVSVVSDGTCGDPDQVRAAGLAPGIVVHCGRPLRPFEADRIARKIAAKAFLGDLLVEWKRVAVGAAE